MGQEKETGKMKERKTLVSFSYILLATADSFKIHSAVAK